MPTRTPAKWKSTKALPEARNILPDEIGLFLQQDSTGHFKSMCTDIWEERLSNKNCINSRNEWYILLQSIFVKNTGILTFPSKIKNVS